MLTEVLREDTPAAPKAGADKGPEPPPPPWSRYQVALEEVAKEVEVAQQSAGDALKLAVELAGGHSSPFQKAIDEIRAIVPSGDAAPHAKLVEILEVPVMNGLKTVLAAAADELDREWKSTIAGPFGGAVSEARLQELYGGGSGGALRQFSDTWLAPFLRAGVPRALVRDQQLPFGPRFLAWLGAAGRMQGTLAGNATAISVRLEGIPSRVITGQVVESKRILQVDCSDQLLSLEYRPSRAHTIPWTPSCTEVKLRVSVLDKGAERELPVRSWKGPLALPSFFRAAERNGDDFVWKVEDQGIELAVPYRMRSGGAILDVAHQTPPESIRE
jgi:hypothetical protein